MALNNTTSNFKNRGKDIKYINKDFVDFRNNLIEFTKSYFPKTYNDFNETSPGMMFIELSSYIGDVLSYYIDDTLKESLMPYAADSRSVMALSQFLGYKPKLSTPSTTKLSVYQLIPSIKSGSVNIPDPKFFLKIKDGMRTESTSTGVQFITTDIVDFSDPTDRDVTVYQTDSITGEVLIYLVKKYVPVISATIKEKVVSFGNYTPFSSIKINDQDFISVYDVRDTNNNKYYEVPYLAQEMIFLDEPNTDRVNGNLSQYSDTVPYILKTIKTPRRFVTKLNSDNTTTIQFGAGDSGLNDELLIPNFKNVGLGLPNSINRLNESFDPTNFLKTKSYGVSPSNTDITVKYYVGGGINSNVPSGDIITINGIEFLDDIDSFTAADKAIYINAKNTIAVDNEFPATGGRGSETIDEIRNNALANFGAQNRAVTDKDYQIRALSMSPKYGSIAKVYAVADGNLDNNSPQSILSSPKHLQEFTDLVVSLTDPSNTRPTKDSIQKAIQSFLLGKATNVNEQNNPFAINLYVLGYDNLKKLTPLNIAVKTNLKTYMNEYRMLTDGINIIDGFVINIGVTFEIIVYPNYNKSEVLLKCINELTDYFSIDNWNFNQTINISEIELALANVEGVQSVPHVEITNKCGGQYSPNSYNILAATKDKIIYPSMDPSIFEVKYPESDIKGKVR
jgi:hypothetical protein